MFVAVGKGVVAAAGRHGPGVHQPDAVRAGLLAAGWWLCVAGWCEAAVRALVADCCAAVWVATEFVAAVA